MDHRLASMGEIHDREEYIAFETSLATGSRDLCRPYELFAANEALTATILRGHGHMVDGGVPFEIHIGVLLEWRDGIAVRLEGFDAESEAALLARFEQLA